MSRRLSSLPRIACTGFHVGCPGFGTAESPGWQVWNDASSDILRGSFAAGKSVERPVIENDSLTAALFPAARELLRLGLWEKGGLTVDPERVAIFFPSSKGELARLAVDATQYTCDVAATWWGRTLQSRGAMFSPVAACASGAHAVALAAQYIQDGYADIAICGGIELEQTPLVMAGYAQSGALSKSGVMRPFDKARDGFVTGQGAAMLVLESEAHAQARGAQVHGYIDGWSICGDATAMTTMQPSGETIARAIEQALRRAGLSGVDYINAHGTATRQNDEVESRGIEKALGRSVAVSSTKALTGHWLGAAGALEAIVCLSAMRESFAPPTLNLQEPDTGCDLDYISCAGREMAVNSCLSLSYGFGGHIGALVVQNK